MAINNHLKLVKGLTCRGVYIPSQYFFLRPRTQEPTGKRIGKIAASAAVAHIGLQAVASGKLLVHVDYLFIEVLEVIGDGAKGIGLIL